MKKVTLMHCLTLGLLMLLVLSSATPVVAASLTPDEEQNLLFIREEEKLARDFYNKMYEKWGSKVFYSISLSEQKHMDAVLRLLVKYGVPDPASAEIGVFNNTELQTLYNQLKLQGERSLLDALLAGAYIEEFDIKDLLSAIEGTNKVDLIRVYSNLELGSESHLRAFVSHIEAITGTPYVAQILDQEEVDAILADVTADPGQKTYQMR